MMHGGEIFIPKIASMRITDLATAICARCEHETVGIRPGEKLHELVDYARRCAAYPRIRFVFVIQPAVHLWNQEDHGTYDGEQGRPVAPDFEYASDSNSNWLDTEQLQSRDRVAGCPRGFSVTGRQNIDRSDIDAVVAVLESDFLTQGPQVERFEAALAERVGASHAVAVSSGTAALHIACLAAGIGPGDLGLTSAITFAASANCLIYAGGEADFVDIDCDTLGMATPALQRALEAAPAAKVIIPVHMAGLAHAAAEIRKLAAGRIVIEDAAHALGGLYSCGKPIGSCAYSDLTDFSFHPVKQITTGEGGAVLTNDPELAHRLRLLLSHGIEREATRFVGDATLEDGRVKPWLAEQQMLGFNYRMTDIAAALGLIATKKA